jgi:hypothetical protein
MAYGEELGRILSVFFHHGMYPRSLLRRYALMQMQSDLLLHVCVLQAKLVHAVLP